MVVVGEEPGLPYTRLLRIPRVPFLSTRTLHLPAYPPQDDKPPPSYDSVEAIDLPSYSQLSVHQAAATHGSLTRVISRV